MPTEFQTVWSHCRWPLQSLTVLGLLFSCVIIRPPLTIPTILTCVSWMLLSVGLTLINDYYDQDTEPVAGLDVPPPVIKAVFVTGVLCKLLAIVLALLVSSQLGRVVSFGALLSFAYSHPRIRVKRFAFGALVFNFLSGFGTFWAVRLLVPSFAYGGVGGITVGVMVSGIYLLMQLHQVKADQQRGDQSVAALLGRLATVLVALVLLSSGALSAGWLMWKAHNQLIAWGVIAVVTFGVAGLGWWKYPPTQDPYRFIQFLLSKVVIVGIVMFSFILLLGAVSSP